MIRKPAPLRRGDVIGVVAPGGAVDEASLQAGVRVLEDAGFRIQLGAAARNQAGYLAGTDHERAKDLHEMFRAPAIKAIIAARGGYGSGRLLPLIDPAEIRQHPKIFVGHSDLTFLLNDFVQRAELVSFHGPMITGLQQRPEAAESLLRMLTGNRIGWHQPAQDVVQPGTAEGPLVGGCLSAIVATLGTPYALETRGCLLFLEDVNEKPYRVDRMLTQLRQAGALGEVAGVIFGEMSGCIATENERVSVRDVIAEAFADAPYPVAFGLPSGHGLGTLTLPLGIRARLAGERLTLLESPVAEQC
ncbi:MAG TPA: LD-carboxypeptidase [Candidatus Binatia bacterium]|jgi:muramoyltetrapeptide carboxypeptidase